MNKFVILSQFSIRCWYYRKRYKLDQQQTLKQVQLLSSSAIYFNLNLKPALLQLKSIITILHQPTSTHLTTQFINMDTQQNSPIHPTNPNPNTKLFFTTETQPQPSITHSQPKSQTDSQKPNYQDQTKQQQPLPEQQQYQPLESYIISKTLGKGNFGKVKLALHKLTQQYVAVKILQKDLIFQNTDIVRITRQLKIMKKLRHPFCVQLYEIIETTKELYLIMEYAEGGDLFDKIVTEERIKETQAALIFTQISLGMEYFHSKGVTHRDLKPENILLSKDGTIKIADFGLGNMFKPDQKLKTACGSPCYASPQMLNRQAYDPKKIDIWSSGIILYAMVCGYLPFQDPVTAKLYDKIKTTNIKLPSWVSSPCRNLIRGLLTKDPKLRYDIDSILSHQIIAPHAQQMRQVIKQKQLTENKIEEICQMYDIEEKSKLVSDLSKNRHNNLTTLYFLAVKRIQKLEKEEQQEEGQLLKKENNKGRMKEIPLVIIQVEHKEEIKINFQTKAEIQNNQIAEQSKMVEQNNQLNEESPVQNDKDFKESEENLLEEGEIKNNKLKEQNSLSVKQIVEIEQISNDVDQIKNAQEKLDNQEASNMVDESNVLNIQFKGDDSEHRMDYQETSKPISLQREQQETNTLEEQEQNLRQIDESKVLSDDELEIHKLHQEMNYETEHLQMDQIQNYKETEEQGKDQEMEFEEKLSVQQNHIEQQNHKKQQNLREMSQEEDNLQRIQHKVDYEQKQQELLGTIEIQDEIPQTHKNQQQYLKDQSQTSFLNMPQASTQPMQPQSQMKSNLIQQSYQLSLQIQKTLQQLSRLNQTSVVTEFVTADNQKNQRIEFNNQRNDNLQFNNQIQTKEITESLLNSPIQNVDKNQKLTEAHSQTIQPLQQTITLSHPQTITLPQSSTINPPYSQSLAEQYLPKSNQAQEQKSTEIHLQTENEQQIKIDPQTIIQPQNQPVQISQTILSSQVQQDRIAKLQQKQNDQIELDQELSNPLDEQQAQVHIVEVQEQISDKIQKEHILVVKNEEETSIQPQKILPQENIHFKQELQSLVISKENLKPVQELLYLDLLKENLTPFQAIKEKLSAAIIQQTEISQQQKTKNLLEPESNDLKKQLQVLKTKNDVTIKQEHKQQTKQERKRKIIQQKQETKPIKQKQENKQIKQKETKLKRQPLKNQLFSTDQIIPQVKPSKTNQSEQKTQKSTKTYPFDQQAQIPQKQTRNRIYERNIRLNERSHSKDAPIVFKSNKNQNLPFKTQKQKQPNQSAKEQLSSQKIKVSSARNNPSSINKKPVENKEKTLNIADKKESVRQKFTIAKQKPLTSNQQRLPIKQKPPASKESKESFSPKQSLTNRKQQEAMLPKKLEERGNQIKDESNTKSNQAMSKKYSHAMQIKQEEETSKDKLDSKGRMKTTSLIIGGSSNKSKTNYGNRFKKTIDESKQQKTPISPVSKFYPHDISAHFNSIEFPYSNQPSGINSSLTQQNKETQSQHQILESQTEMNTKILRKVQLSKTIVSPTVRGKYTRQYSDANNSPLISTVYNSYAKAHSSKLINTGQNKFNKTFSSISNHDKTLDKKENNLSFGSFYPIHKGEKQGIYQNNNTISSEKKPLNIEFYSGQPQLINPDLILLVSVQELNHLLQGLSGSKHHPLANLKGTITLYQYPSKDYLYVVKSNLFKTLSLNTQKKTSITYTATKESSKNQTKIDSFQLVQLINTIILTD